MYFKKDTCTRILNLLCFIICAQNTRLGFGCFYFCNSIKKKTSKYDNLFFINVLNNNVWFCVVVGFFPNRKIDFLLSGGR